MFGCDRKKYIIVPNAVNGYWFQGQTEFRTLHNPISLIFVGEITKNKNVSTSITVVSELSKTDIDVVFHIIGAGDDEENCRSLAEKLNVSDKVFFHGWQNSKDKIKKYYDQADIFIMPSFRESFGTVYVEALSQGLPIIYTKGQGIDGYFEQGSVGFSCNPEDADGIKTAILSIIDNYQTISAKCITESKMFQWEIVSNQYFNILNDMRKK